MDVQTNELRYMEISRERLLEKIRQGEIKWVAQDTLYGVKVVNLIDSSGVINKCLDNKAEIKWFRNYCKAYEKL